MRKVHSELGVGNRWLTLETDQLGAKPVVKGSAAGLQPNGLALFPSGNKAEQSAHIKALATLVKARTKATPTAAAVGGKSAATGPEAAGPPQPPTTRPLAWIGVGVAGLLILLLGMNFLGPSTVQSGTGLCRPSWLPQH